MELEREILGKATARPTPALPGRVPRPGSPLHFRSVRICEGGAPLRSSGLAVHRVATMCRVLEVSRSGYYAWLKRETSDRARANAALLKVIEEIHEESDGTYGAPRVHAELEDRGPPASLNRVARVMREAEIQGVSPRKWTHTTLRGKRDRPAPDLVDRDFTATGPDQLWVADITYIPTWAGFLFLAIVLDVWSRRVVGWAMATHMRTELVLDALDMALARRKPRGVIHHSDQGCQYTSLTFGRRCELMGVLPSMGSVGDAYDKECAPYCTSLRRWSGSVLLTLMRLGWIGSRGLVQALGTGTAARVGFEQPGLIPLANG